MIRRNAVVTSIALAAFAFSGFAAIPQARAVQAASSSVFNTLSSDPRFTTTMKMVYVAGASSRLSTAENVAIFAPTDQGWDNSPYEGMLSSLTSTGAGSEFPDSMGILKIIRGFVVRGQAPQVANAPEQMESAAGRAVMVDAKAMTVKWVDPSGETHTAPLAGQPIIATNGVVYPVDAVVGE